MTIEKEKTALLLGDQLNFAAETGHLLQRAGFVTDIVTSNPLIKPGPPFRIRDLAADPDAVVKAASTRAGAHHYDLIVPLNDDTLRWILQSELSDDEKLQLLPVHSKDDFQHIASKIGLAVALQRHGIAIPRFEVARDADEIRQCIERIGLPVLIKIDFSGGGNGTFDCSRAADLEALAPRISQYPVLVQQKISGIEIDCSAFFCDNKLIFFNYASIDDREAGQFSSSSVRTYTQLGAVGPDAFDEIRRIGAALGANGFANITCIQSADDGHRYYFEADLRPNVWVNFPKYFGDDLADRVAHYFKAGRELAYPCSLDSRFPTRIRLPYFYRLRLWEMIVNRYRCWYYFPHLRIRDWLRDSAHLSASRTTSSMKTAIVRTMKPRLPPRIWRGLKRSNAAIVSIALSTRPARRPSFPAGSKR